MRRRAPTYRERWVKNDDSGTLGFLFLQNQTQFDWELRFFCICDIINMSNSFRHAYGVPPPSTREA
jgi:hypothetical protein